MTVHALDLRAIYAIDAGQVNGIMVFVFVGSVSTRNVIDSDEGLVDAPIGRSERAPTKMAVSGRGRTARTRYKVVERFTEPTVLTLVECRLETGRTHQIRVHLAAIGHPVLGDARYNGVRAAIACPRPFLHAYHLGFEHPSGDPVSFEVDLPADLLAVRAQLR